MSLNMWQKAHAQKKRCVYCGHNDLTDAEVTDACACCKSHCETCFQTTKYPVKNLTGTTVYTTNLCKCCPGCNCYPCVCNRAECDECGYTKQNCSCCGDCETYPCQCHDGDHFDNNSYSPTYGRGSHGVTEAPPWEKDGVVVDARTTNDSYNDFWHIDHSINPATAAADFYITEAIQHDLPNPIRKRTAEVAAQPLTTGVGAWGRIVSGLVALSSDAAVVMHNDGQPVILVRQMTTPEDIHGMKVADGILTTTGGTSSHAAVVARGWNKTCVVGASEIKVGATTLPTFTEGELITIDGSTGAVYRGRATAKGLAAQSKLNGFLAPGGIKDEDYFDESNVLNCYKPSHKAITYSNNERSFAVDADGISTEIQPDPNYGEDQRRLASLMERAGLTGESLEDVLQEAKITHQVLVAWYAENFRKAAHCAIGGELRHHRCIGGTVVNANNRSAAWSGWIDVVKAVGVGRALRAAEQLFMEMGGSYGGKRWAASAEALRMYEEGELSDALWVDRVMTLTHNGGMLLDKIQWKGKNSKGMGINHMVEYVLPAHGEGNYKLLLKLASPRVVELWNRYWDAANRARLLNGQPIRPNTAGITQPPRYACSRCFSKPWIGHHRTCSNVNIGYVQNYPYVPDNPASTYWVCTIDEDNFGGGYDWSKWTDGPYYFDVAGKSNQDGTRTKPVVEVQYENPGWSPKATTITVTSVKPDSAGKPDPQLEILLVEEEMKLAKGDLDLAAKSGDGQAYAKAWKHYIASKKIYNKLIIGGK